jgi:RNA polymerase sigma-70 factor (ECF subfamily)
MTRPHDPLSRLLARLADGDREAFDPLFEAAWPRVRGVCVRVLGDGPQADDAAQQAMLDVFRRASDYDPSRAALPWLVGIAGWTCRTHLRRVARQRLAPLDGAEPLALGPSPEEAALDAELRRAVRAAVADLSPLDAETLWDTLARDEGLLDRPAAPAGATLRKRLQRASGRLRALWEARHGDT